jgi:hypothetical protein
MWRMGWCATKFSPQNKNFVAHLPMRHRKYYFCGAPGKVRHRKRKYHFCGAPAVVRHRIFKKIMGPPIFLSFFCNFSGRSPKVRGWVGWVSG